MKKAQGISLLLLLLAAAGCGPERRNEIVTENYIHKFGVPISKSDWARNGHDGQVVQLLTNGVTQVRNYEKGVLQGKTTYTFPNSSTLAIIETYDKGQLISRIENYPSGVAKVEEIYENALLAARTQWYEEGTPAQIERYDAGYLCTGEYLTPMNITESRVDEQIGVRINRSGTGSLVSRDTIRAGQVVEKITYYANEEPDAITAYENGMIHGTRLTFLAGGIPSTVENWIHGNQEGTTIVYRNGEKVAEVPYVKGEKHGIEYRFRDGKVLVEQVTWRQGVQHGPRRILVDGQEAKTEWYHKGEMVNRTTYERLNLPDQTVRLGG